MKTFAASLATLAFLSGGLLAQTPTMSCKDQNQGGNRGFAFCEVRETTLASLATLNVDGRQNGGISIKGANRADILVRAMVQARGDTDAEAKTTGAQVIVHTSAGTVQADGPAQKNWSVSYEIFVPQKTNLSLKANNGGLAVAGVESSIEFHSVNGGISLKNVGGNVHGDTVNGGVSVTLADARWNGQGLDVSTQNGGVSLKVPDQFSAILDVATVNGGMNVKLPNAQVKRAEHTMNVTLGSGGPLLRIRTQNGGVSVSGGSTPA
jgi:DUF4097 and DUF4098 domain-containing protein YvlB